MEEWPEDLPWPILRSHEGVQEPSPSYLSWIPPHLAQDPLPYVSSPSDGSFSTSGLHSPSIQGICSDEFDPGMPFSMHNPDALQTFDDVASLLMDEDMDVQCLAELPSSEAVLQELQDLVEPSMEEDSGMDSDLGRNTGFDSEPSSSSSYSSTNKCSSFKAFDKLGMQTRLIEQLIDCAKAVAAGNKSSIDMIKSLSQHVSRTGSATERLVFFFVEGLTARISGKRFSVNTKYASPSAADVFDAIKVIGVKTPFYRLHYLFSNQTIYNSCLRQKKVHIVDYGTKYLYGFQWPLLIRNLAQRPGGPPQVRMTLVDSPSQYSGKGSLKEIATRLINFAASYNMTLYVHPIEDEWEKAQPFLLDNEFLIVNCMLGQYELMDESELSESPRNMWLRRVASMKPKLFIKEVSNVQETSHLFVTRLLDMLPFYGMFLDCIASCMPDGPEKHFLEHWTVGKCIFNAIAIEGRERRQRSETYEQWHFRAENVGFQLQPVESTILTASEDLLSSYHREFSLKKDGGWLLLCWKNHVLHAFGAWKHHQSRMKVIDVDEVVDLDKEEVIDLEQQDIIDLEDEVIDLDK